MAASNVITAPFSSKLNEASLLLGRVHAHLDVLYTLACSSKDGVEMLGEGTLAGVVDSLMTQTAEAKRIIDES